MNLCARKNLKKRRGAGEPNETRRGARGFVDAISPGKWRPEDFEKIVDRMRKQQRGLYDVCSDEDLPSHAAWHVFSRKNPSFEAKLRRAYFRMPYSMQIKHCRISPKFRIDCKRLLDRGMHPARIAEALGVSLRIVKRFLQDDAG